MARPTFILAILMHFASSIVALKHCNPNGTSVELDVFDSINDAAFKVTRHGLPVCLKGETIHQNENWKNSNNPSFVLLNETLLILEDHSRHTEFCLESYGDYTIAQYCQASLESRCESLDCVRQCCQIQQVPMSKFKLSCMQRSGKIIK